MSKDLTGEKLGKYEVHDLIGRGGAGLVYRGRDPDLERDVAIKILAPSLVAEEQVLKRFKREARLAANLRHPNIVTIHDVGQQDQWHYFVMEYLEGQTLAEIIEARAPLPLDEVMAILCPLAAALDYAHSQHIVHRDVKPANIVVGSEQQVTLTDFGIVHAAHETRMTVDGTLMGTPRYMSPEQVEGDSVGPASDQYSLAVVAYEMLSGQVPFQVENPASMLYKIAHERTPPIGRVQPGLPAGVEAVMQKALSKDPADRYPSVSAFVAALGQAIVAETASERTIAALRAITPVPVSRPSQPTPAPASPQPVRPPLPRWVWGAGGLLALAVVIALAALLLKGGPRASGEEPAQTPVAPAATLAPSPTPSPTPVTPPMVEVPAGEFTMGTRFGVDYEQPPHVVYLDAFWIDRTEVTNAQFAAFVQATGYRTEAEHEGGGRLYSQQGRVLTAGADWRHPQGPGSSLEGLDDYPVVLISWNDALAYCQWRAARLPTEAEWEKAARDDTGNRYPWGSEFVRDNLNYCDGNCPFDWRVAVADDGYARTAPAGSYPAGASPYGALDMEGNVREWVSDWFDEAYYASSPARNPAGPVDGQTRVARGSAWFDVEWYIRSTDRFAFAPTYAGDDTGIRCARSEPPR